MRGSGLTVARGPRRRLSARAVRTQTAKLRYGRNASRDAETPGEIVGVDDERVAERR